MPAFVDLTGHKYGKLLVLERAPNTKAGVMWKCICDCGKIKNAHSGEMRIGKVVSCGCQRLASIKNIDRSFSVKINEPKTRCINKVFSYYKNSASKKGMDFSLTKDEFISLAESNCSYCGSPPSNSSNHYGTKYTPVSQWSYNGIDRVDSSIGYVSGNCVPACICCNQAKNDLSVSEFKSLVAKQHFVMNCGTRDGHYMRGRKWAA